MGLTHFIVATAGHVDHGKTALVRALTGTDTDRLPEEKRRGITIELGFAHLDLPAPNRSDQTYRIGIVDVPGHEDFVKNMVAGVGSVDLALLVVAADDGWMPQTEEHLQILTYLGVRRGIVALTKIDLAAPENVTERQIREKLRGTPLADAAIVATSVVSGRGIEQLKSALAQELARTPVQKDLGKPRLAVDRAFTLRGVGTVVTGTLTGGTLRRGQSAVVQPGAKPTRIRAIQSYNRDVEQAQPGSRVALNLSDLQVGGTTHNSASVSRGETVTLPELGRAGDTLDVLLEISPRSTINRPLKEATRVRIHHGSGSVSGVIYLHGMPALQQGGRSVAQIRLDTPVFAFIGDRFVVRDASEQFTLAGGIVLDPDAPRRGFRGESRQTFLQHRADRVEDVVACLETEIARLGATEAGSLLRKSLFSTPEVKDGLTQLERRGRVFAYGSLVADALWWNELRNQASAAVDAFHRSRPQEPGMRLAGLRQQLARGLQRIEAFDALVEDLCRHGFVKEGVTIRRASHRAALPPHLQPAGVKLRNLLTSTPFEPLTRKELAGDRLSQQALHFLLQIGEAVEIGDDLLLHADQYARAVETIRAHLATRAGGATVSELKQLLNSSRRVMVPLLERLDRDGITARQGDRRILRTPK